MSACSKIRWLAGGFKLRVVNRVLEAIQQCEQQSKSDHAITVFVTGMQQQRIMPCHA